MIPTSSSISQPLLRIHKRANAILNHMHGVLADMMQTSGLNMSQTGNSNDIDAFLTNAAWAIHATHHMVLQSSLGTAIFGQDMLFDIPYIADWNAIGWRRQTTVNYDTERMNKKHLDHNYTIGQKVLLLKDGMLCKAEDRYTGPWTITEVHCNGTDRIQHGTVSERLNIRRITPFFK